MSRKKSSKKPSSSKKPASKKRSTVTKARYERELKKGLDTASVVARRRTLYLEQRGTPFEVRLFRAADAQSVRPDAPDDVKLAVESVRHCSTKEGLPAIAIRNISVVHKALNFPLFKPPKSNRDTEINRPVYSLKKQMVQYLKCDVDVSNRPGNKAGRVYSHSNPYSDDKEMVLAHPASASMETCQNWPDNNKGPRKGTVLGRTV